MRVIVRYLTSIPADTVSDHFLGGLTQHPSLISARTNTLSQESSDASLETNDRNLLQIHSECKLIADQSTILSRTKGSFIIYLTEDLSK